MKMKNPIVDDDVDDNDDNVNNTDVAISTMQFRRTNIPALFQR